MHRKYEMNPDLWCDPVPKFPNLWNGSSNTHKDMLQINQFIFAQWHVSYVIAVPKPAKSIVDMCKWYMCHMQYWAHC